MSGSDGVPLPRDPGPVPMALREAFARASAGESAMLSLPEEDQIELLAMGEGDDDLRLSTIDQLLITAEGSVVVAHLVAARGATVGSEQQIQSLTGSYPTPVSTGVPAGVLDMQARRAGPTRVMGFRPLVLAASLMLLAGTSWYVRSALGAGDEIRASLADLELLAVAPSAASKPITLRWKPLRADTRYSVEVLDADDAPVFQFETSATRGIVPAALLTAGTYRWYVRARMADQSEIRSRVESFVVR